VNFFAVSRPRALIIRSTRVIPLPQEKNKMAYQYETISTRLDDGVLTAVLSNPPVNV